MNKEQIHDEKIGPLMQQIIDACKEHDIEFIASFDIPTDEDPGLRCTSAIFKKAEGFAEALRAIRQTPSTMAITIATNKARAALSAQKGEEGK